jgi:hypothetical protein
LEQHARMLGVDLATLIYCLHVESTDLNLLLSAGSCFMISGESKIG